MTCFLSFQVVTWIMPFLHLFSLICDVARLDHPRTTAFKALFDNLWKGISHPSLVFFSVDVVVPTSNQSNFENSVYARLIDVYQLSVYKILPLSRVRLAFIISLKTTASAVESSLQPFPRYISHPRV